MSKNKRKRPQSPKATGPNERYVEAMQGLRRSNAAQPHKSKKAYQRKPKHGGWV